VCPGPQGWTTCEADLFQLINTDVLCACDIGVLKEKRAEGGSKGEEGGRGGRLRGGVGG